MTLHLRRVGDGEFWGPGPESGGETWPRVRRGLGGPKKAENGQIGQKRPKKPKKPKFAKMTRKWPEKHPLFPQGALRCTLLVKARDEAILSILAGSAMLQTPA